MKSLYRFALDVAKSFGKDDAYDRASALAFYSALSIVPALAVLFGIAQGFGFGQNLESELSSQFYTQPEMTSKLIQFAHSWLQNVEGGVIAGVGTAILLWSAISLLNSVENTLNEIWKIKAGRSLIHKIRDYLNVLFIAPLILVLASSINIYLITQIAGTASSNVYIKAISPVLFGLLNLFPFFLSWVLFTFIYLFIPNTKVYFRDAGLAAVIAGTAFQIWQWLYIKFQLNVTTYSTVYGSFAAVPLFLIWLQVSWLIVLAGAEIAVALENRFFSRSAEPHSIPMKSAALLVAYHCVEAFKQGEGPLTDLTLSHKLGIPLNQMHRILEILTQNQLLAEVSSGGDIIGYQPARPIADISFQDVADAVERQVEVPVYGRDSAELKRIEDVLQKMGQASENALGNQSLYALISAEG